MSSATSKLPVIFITGVGGVLGSRVVQSAERRGYRVRRHYHRKPESVNDAVFGDLGDESHVKELSRNINPDLIINCAALADVDRCERERELSQKANVDSVTRLTEYFPQAGLIHISTDYVFPGKRAQPRRNDPTEPINIYGRHKLEAEKVVLNASKNTAVIRAVLMFDNVSKRNFYRFVFQSLRDGKKVEGITDQYTNPISAPGAANIIIDLVEKKATGIWHIGGADYVNRFEFSCRIAEFFNLDTNLIVPVNSDKVSRPAARPKLAGLDVSETFKLLEYPAPRLDEEFALINKPDA